MNFFHDAADDDGDDDDATASEARARASAHALMIALERHARVRDGRSGVGL